MELNVFTKAMQLAQEAHQDILQDMQGDGFSDFDDAQREAAVALDGQLTDAASRMEAVVARIQGEFDNPCLVKFGALNVDPAQDVIRILTESYPHGREYVGMSMKPTCVSCEFCDEVRPAA